MEEITFMALSDTFTTLGNTIINLINSRTAHKQNQLIAGDGIQITENSEEKNADICIHPDIEAAFQSVISELNEEAANSTGLPDWGGTDGGHDDWKDSSEGGHTNGDEGGYGDGGYS